MREKLPEEAEKPVKTFKAAVFGWVLTPCKFR
jgi:hypothetical protein